MTRPDALLMFSGGLDSVQALHARLVAGRSTRVHHVRLRNWEGRAAHEHRAVRRVLSWAQRNGYSRLIDYTESGFDYGDLRYVVRDHNVWGLFAGIILANPANAHLTQVIRTFHRDSVVGGLESAAGQAAETGWRVPIERLAKHDVEFVYPQIGMTKAEIIAALPDDLLAASWWCRRPRAGKPCHRCHTCRQVDAARAGEPWVPLDERGAAGETPAPPKGNASREAWAEYARARGVDVPDDATRNEIKAAVRGV